MRVVLVLALAASAAPGHASDGWVVTGEASVVVDWTGGIVVAPGAGAPDPRAPLGGISRVGAARTAERAARQKLERTVRKLAFADGKLVGELVDADRTKMARLKVAIDGARRRDQRYASDGSTELSLALPLESVRAALTPVYWRPEADASAPTAIVVDARGHKLLPMMGIQLVAGDVTWAGPTVWHRSNSSAQKDARAGARVVRTKVLSRRGAGLVIDMDKKSLARARRAGTLVLMVTGENTP